MPTRNVWGHRWAWVRGSADDGDEGGLGPEARLQELMTDHLQQDALTQEKLDHQKQRKQELGPQEAIRGPQHGVSVDVAQVEDEK